jgi:hypothetical protein
MSAPIVPQDVRDYANLPSEVPEALLDKHIGIALREVARRTGLTQAPSGQDDNWSEAHTVYALASAFPWLNTFALDGAAKVGRLEGEVEARFLDADETQERIDRLLDRFDALVATLLSDDADETGVSFGDYWMTAI